MTRLHVLFLISISLVAGGIARDRQIRSYRASIDSVTELACDVVAARAQAGSTRDVHDQLYAFIRKHAPDPHAQVLVSNGGRHVGASNSNLDRLAADDKIEKSCKFKNAPEYEIVFQFQSERFWSLDLVTAVIAAFAGFGLLAWLALVVLQQLRKVWIGQFSNEIRRNLGLASGETARSNSVIARLTRPMLFSLSPIRNEIQELQGSLKANKTDLIETRSSLVELETEKRRADQFASIVRQIRHDLKGPLSTLKFAALERRAESSDLLGLTLKSIERIVGDLDSQALDLESDSGVLELEIAEVAIAEVVAEKQELVRLLKGISVKFEYDVSKLNPVRCEPRLFRRVFANLVQNAIEASPNGGAILVRCGSETEGRLRIDVIDHGVGISSERLDQVFEPGATFGKPNGTGMGLSFVRATVNKWGGSINASSAEDHGSQFSIMLPVADSGASFRAMPPLGPDAKLVVLDDDVELHRTFWSNTVLEPNLFACPQKLMDWVESSPESESTSFVIDLHLKDIITGIDVLRTLDCAGQKYLATSDYLNSEALEISATANVPIIPKSLLFSRVVPSQVRSSDLGSHVARPIGEYS